MWSQVSYSNNFPREALAEYDGELVGSLSSGTYGVFQSFAILRNGRHTNLVAALLAGK